MKLQSVKYDESDVSWHPSNFVPSNPRSVLVYTKEGGVAEASYSSLKDTWTQFRWNCEIEPLCWREMPVYDNKISL